MPIQRILKDLAQCKDLENDVDGIYIYGDQFDDLDCMLLFKGDSVYSYSIMHLKITLPDSYPFIPPVIRFIQPNSNFRFHPNLYKCGKICMSILGTWDVSTWEPVYRLYSCLLSIKAQINLDFPINAEPLYKTSNYLKLLYNKNITYNSLRYLLIENYNTLVKIDKFKDVLNNHIYKYKEELFKIIDEQKEELFKIIDEQKSIKLTIADQSHSFIFPIETDLDYDILIKKLLTFYLSIETS